MNRCRDIDNSIVRGTDIHGEEPEEDTEHPQNS